MTRYAPQWLQASSYAAGVDRRLLGALWPLPACAGCAVTPGAGMQVSVAAGQVAAPTPNNTGSTLCTSDAPEPVTLIAAPAAGNNRIDLVICQPRGNDLDGGVNNDFVFSAIAGAVAASPTVPAIPAGAVALAQVYVAGGSSAIVAGNITDLRPGRLRIPGGPPSDPTLSATTVTTTDATGEVWVAKAGVNGGAWRRARDVIVTEVYRSAAQNVGTGDTYIFFDTIVKDAYACWTLPGNTAFTCPAAGVYLLDTIQQVVAPNILSILRIMHNGVLARQVGSAPAGACVNLTTSILCAVGDTLSVMGRANVAGAPIGPGQVTAYCAVRFAGSS
jgi:hypothetical protein